MSLNRQNKKIRWVTILMAVLILIMGYVIFIGIFVEFNSLTTNKFVIQTTRLVPYPVAIVGTQMISYSKLINQLKAVKRFYQNQDFSRLGFRVDFSTDEGKKKLKIKEKNVLEKLIENTVIKDEAQKRGIKLTSAIINEEVDRKLKEYGSENKLKNNLKKLYGWNIKDFKENIVEPDIYKTKLFAQIRNTDQSYVLAEKKIKKAQKELKAGESFSIVAKKYSMGKSAQQGGELGWFKANQMIPAVAQVAFQLNKNQISPIIKSSLGYHIIKIDDRKKESNVVMVKISQIFIKTKSFSQWLSQLEKKQKIFILLREFKWNQSKTQLEFRDAAMQKFEDNLIKNPSNDPSIMF